MVAGSDDVANHDRPGETRQRAHTLRFVKKRSGGERRWPVLLPTVPPPIPRHYYRREEYAHKQQDTPRVYF
jgi:hypothetical protein